MHTHTQTHVHTHTHTYAPQNVMVYMLKQYITIAHDQDLKLDISTHSCQCSKKLIIYKFYRYSTSLQCIATYMTECDEGAYI